MSFDISTLKDRDNKTIYPRTLIEALCSLTGESFEDVSNKLIMNRLTEEVSEYRDNLIINGDFILWGKNTTVTGKTGIAECSRRWLFNGLNSTASKTDNGIKLSNMINGCRIIQGIERRLSEYCIGKKLNLSLMVKADNFGSTNLTISLISLKGDIETVVTEEKVSAISSYALITLAGVIPEETENIIVAINCEDTASDVSIYLKNVNLVIGDYRRYIPRRYVDELMLANQFVEDSLASIRETGVFENGCHELQDGTKLFYGTQVCTYSDGYFLSGTVNLPVVFKQTTPVYMTTIHGDNSENTTMTKMNLISDEDVNNTSFEIFVYNGCNSYKAEDSVEVSWFVIGK